MKKLVYEYTNGLQKIHTTFITKKTMLRESKGARRVTIYKCDELELIKREEGYTSGEYITTILLI